MTSSTDHRPTCVLNVMQTADAVLQFQPVAGRSLWRSWLESSRSRHLLDAVRAFIAALEHVLDTPSFELSHVDLVEISRQIERVTTLLEAHIDCLRDHPGEAGPLASAIYLMQAQYEKVARHIQNR